MKFVDSSVLVASAIEASPHFEASNRFLESNTAKTCATSAHALVETYATLTRLPAAHRLSPKQAHAAVSNWSGALKVITLTVDQTLDLLERNARSAVTGGRVYDSLHARAAAIEGVSAIVTWNVRHFIGLEAAIEIETP